MALNDVLSQVTIHQVWEALGGSEYKGKAGDDANWSKAFWRSGDGWNIHLLPDSNIWIDFAHHQEEAENGKYKGMLGLVCLVLGLETRAQAVRWIETKILGLEIGSEAPKPDASLSSAKRWRDALVLVKEAEASQCDTWKLRISTVLESDESEGLWNHYAWVCRHQYLLSGEISSLLTLTDQESVERYHQAEAQTISKTLAIAEQIRQDRNWSAPLLERVFQAMGQQQQTSVQLLRCFGNGLYRQRSPLFCLLVWEILRYQQFGEAVQAVRFDGSYSNFLEVVAKQRKQRQPVSERQAA